MKKKKKRNSFKEIENAQNVYNNCVEILLRFAEVNLIIKKKKKKHGLIHSDFNEFNIMMNEEGKITVIDFP